MVIYQAMHGGFRWRSIDEIAQKRAEMDANEQQSRPSDEKGSVTASERDEPSLEDLDKKSINVGVEVV